MTQSQLQVKIKLEVNEEMDQKTILLAQDEEARLELRKDGFLALVNVNNRSIIDSNNFHGPEDAYKIRLNANGQVEEFDSKGSIVWSGGKKHPEGPRYYLSVSNIPTGCVFEAAAPKFRYKGRPFAILMRFIKKTEDPTLTQDKLVECIFKM